MTPPEPAEVTCTGAALDLDLDARAVAGLRELVEFARAMAAGVLQGMPPSDLTAQHLSTLARVRDGIEWCRSILEYRDLAIAAEDRCERCGGVHPPVYPPAARN
jgi:hypothetical protein